MQIAEDKIYNGLNDSEVEQSRKKHGTNVLTQKEKVPAWRLYLEKFQDPIIRILLIAALLSFAVAFIENDFAETIGIVCAILLATAVGFAFEYDAARKFDVLRSFDDDDEVKTIRNGCMTLVRKRDIVVGDTVVVETGDGVPADGVLLRSESLQVNESSLTGEQTANKQVVDDKEQEHTYPANMLLRSSMVLAGNGVMKVTAVGDQTEVGKLAQDATAAPTENTPLNNQLNRLANWINYVGFGVAAVAFLAFLGHDLYRHFAIESATLNSAAWLWIAEHTLGYFMMAVTVIVMAVPEGLPMAVTLSLAMNMRRMLKTNNLVRRMHACETLGAVTVICTDKTGTLTRNMMKVEEFVATDNDNSLLHTAIALNTTADLSADGSFVGNPTEVALLNWQRDEGKDYRLIRKECKVVDRIPFSTEKKYMATLIALNDGQRIVCIKGAPEVIMEMAGEWSQSDEGMALARKTERLQSQSFRTLAVAIGIMNNNDSDCLEAISKAQINILGVFAIADPLRSDVAAAITTCQSAGVRIKMVTGDVAATAMKIASDAGLVAEGDTIEECCISGKEFEQLTDEQILERIEEIKVICRARPTDKKRLVQLLQQRGEVVAVTGDGTNDAPALNHAHVGVSLGSGTSVAKDASDVTLLDDSFHSLSTAIMWGRSLYRNIQRFLVFQLTINLSALLLVIIGSLVGTELPLTVTQMLWVNLIMDTFAAMALASLPPSADVMGETPRKSSAFILTRSMIQSIVGFGLLFVAILLPLLYSSVSSGGVDIHELTVFFTVFVMLQFWNLLNVRVWGTIGSIFGGLTRCKGLLFVALLILVGQVMIVEFGGKVFRTVPLSLAEWGAIIGLTFLIVPLSEGVRLAKKMIKK